jgi:hypothetical protein
MGPQKTVIFHALEMLNSSFEEEVTHEMNGEE